MWIACKNCGREVERRSNSSEKNVFCSRSCAATYNNKKYPKRRPEGICIICRKRCKTITKYCSAECKEKAKRKRSPIYNGICRKHGKVRIYIFKSGPRCSICIRDSVHKRGKKLKLMAVNHKGGKCAMCGYNKCMSALVFHHTGEKSFNLSTGFMKSWKRMQPELEKCILLCRNCHAEEHERIDKELRKNRMQMENETNKYLDF